MRHRVRGTMSECKCEKMSRDTVQTPIVRASSSLRVHEKRASLEIKQFYLSTCLHVPYPQRCRQSPSLRCLSLISLQDVVGSRNCRCNQWRKQLLRIFNPEFKYVNSNWLMNWNCAKRGFQKPQFWKRDIRDDVRLAQLVKAQDCQSRGRQFDSGKISKTDNSNLHGFKVHRLSSKGTKLLFQEIKAIINQPISV